MMKSLRNTLLISVPLALLTMPVHASETPDQDTQPDLFRALGNFVLDGLGPARTMEDIQREEREARARALEAQRKAEASAEAAAAPDAAPGDSSPAEPVLQAQPVLPDPAKPAPVKMAKVDPAKPAPVEVAPAPPVTPVAVHVDVIPPPPKARPQMDAKALPAAPALPAEPLKSHIAATASVDQALKLGGPTQIYTRRLVID